MTQPKDFSATQEQHLFRESARTFLTATASLERLRATVDSAAGWDERLWAAMAGDMGYAGLMIPETCDGSGLGAVEMAVLLEETGRTLAAVPFFETAVLATQFILSAASAAQRDALLPRIATGEIKAAVAFTGSAGLAVPHDVAAMLTATSTGWQLSGEAGFVTFGHVADLFIVAARARGSHGAQGLSLVALPAAIAGLEVERLPSLDRTRPYSRLRFDNIVLPSDAILGIAESAGPAIDRTLAIGAGLLASEQTGGADFCLASTVEYAGQRVQFGRPIGSFQAVKHTLADMMVKVETARSAAQYAAAAIDEDDEELFEATSVARAWCSDAYRFCAAEAIQLHGGIGFTWEHHAHLYFKRARSSSTWLGDPALHRERVACLMGLDAVP
jgi:alkylation response protein AidB-like acyl-CoA dehydrogenase